eukprot:m.89649 g.89649  ORF g.89649 m.89649 type:complete len:520 (-) comp8837_c1_seq2:1391-2950(-)
MSMQEEEIQPAEECYSTSTTTSSSSASFLPLLKMENGEEHDGGRKGIVDELVNMFPKWRLHSIWNGANDITPVDTTRKKHREKTMVLLNSALYFDACILSIWDDRAGPKNRHMWVGNTKPAETLQSRLLLVLPKVTICNELDRDHAKDGTPAMKYCRLPNEGFELGTFVFEANIDGKMTCCAISLVKQLEPHIIHDNFKHVEEKKLSNFLDLYKICQERMSTLVKKLFIMLKNYSTDEALVSFTNDLAPFLRALPRTLTTYTSIDHLEQSAFRLRKVKGSMELLIEHNFLARCITCHLMTAGRSVVIGKNTDAVMMMMHTLALFLPQRDRKSICWGCSDGSYYPDMMLQVVNNSLDNFGPMLLESSNPSSVIDLDNMLVKQTPTRERFISLKSNTSAFQTNIELVEKKGAAPLVTSFLAQLFALPSQCYIPLITQFTRHLARTALALMEYADTQGATQEHPLSQTRLEAIKKCLNLENQEDLHMVVAMCWKLDEDSHARILGEEGVREDQVTSHFRGHF